MSHALGIERLPARELLDLDGFQTLWGRIGRRTDALSEAGEHTARVHTLAFRKLLRRLHEHGLTGLHSTPPTPITGLRPKTLRRVVVFGWVPAEPSKLDPQPVYPHPCRLLRDVEGFADFFQAPTFGQ